MANHGATRLAIVGASARAAAFSALRAGFDVVTADLFADEDLRRRCPATRIDNYPEGLAAWLAEQDVDAWMYTGALENYPDLVDRMAAIKPLWGNHGKALRRCRDPFVLQHVFAGTTIGFPETRSVSDGLPLDGSWLCKTYRGASGCGVWTLDSEESLARADSEHAVFQKRVLGTSASSIHLVLSESATRVESVAEQLVGTPAYGAASWSYCGSVAWKDGPFHKAGLHAELSRVLGGDLGLRGLVGIDFVVDGTEFWVVEINPRYAASAEVGERPRSAVAGHAIAFGHERQRVTPTAGDRYAAKAILYAKSPLIIDRDISRWTMAQSTAVCLADIPAVGAKIEQGQPVLSVLVGGSVDGAADRLSQAVLRIESELYSDEGPTCD